MGRNKWKDNRRKKMLAWQSGEYADECHDRWTNADMVWAYDYGFKQGLVKKEILPKSKIPKEISFNIKDKDGKKRKITFKSRGCSHKKQKPKGLSSYYYYSYYGKSKMSKM